MCKRELSNVKTNFYKLRGITEVEGKILKVYYGAYCKDNKAIEELGSKAIEFLKIVMPKAVEGFEYTVSEVHDMGNVRETPKGITIEEALVSEVEKDITIIGTVMGTLEREFDEVKVDKSVDSKIRSKAKYTDYKAELDWKLKLMEDLEGIKETYKA